MLLWVLAVVQLPASGALVYPWLLQDAHIAPPGTSVCSVLIHAGLASTALVLSIAAPFGGNAWYALTALSPLSGFYYWQRGTRREEVLVTVLQRLSPFAPCWSYTGPTPLSRHAFGSARGQMAALACIFPRQHTGDLGGIFSSVVTCKVCAMAQVKMVTSDDERTTDILCEGPEEEIERLRREFGLAEKGKVLVKGLLER